MRAREIEEKLLQILAARTSRRLTPVELAGETGLKQLLDSVMLMELMVGIEEELGLMVDESSIPVEHFSSVRALALFLEARLRTSGPT